MERNDLEVTRMSHFVGIGLVLGFLLPRTSTAFLMVNPLLCLFYLLFKQNRIFYRNNWIVLVPLMMTFAVNLPQDVNTKAILSALTVLMYFFCFPIVGKVKVPIFYFYLILAVILSTQLAYVLDIPILVSYLDAYYPIPETFLKKYEHMQSNITEENMLDFRMGGLYRNSNDCSRQLSFLLAGFLILFKEISLRKWLPFVVACFYAVLLTGSRTGFVVASSLIIFYLFVNKKLSVGLRLVFVLLAIGAFLYIPFYESDSLRGFDVFRTGSVDKKMDTFRYYLFTETSALRILLGYLDADRFDITYAPERIMSSFDSDYGSIIFSYGFMGFLAILLYFFTIFKKMDKYGRLYFIVLLWMYSSTIVKSYRGFFTFMLLLSIVYGISKKPELKHRSFRLRELFFRNFSKHI